MEKVDEGEINSQRVAPPLGLEMAKPEPKGRSKSQEQATTRTLAAEWLTRKGWAQRDASVQPSCRSCMEHVYMSSSSIFCTPLAYHCPPT